MAGTIPQPFRIERRSLGAHSELQYSSDRLTANAGFNFEKAEGFGEVTSPRLGITWRPREASPRLKASWAKGSKLPSFYSFANPVIGNPRLRPERARSFDTGVEQGVGPATLSATYFRNDFQDLVDFDSVRFRLVNRSEARI